MKLIDKDKVVAEIERRIADNKKDIERASHKNLEDYFEGYEDALVLLKQQYLDTIETKEVDLEKEIKSFTEDLFHKVFDEDKSQDDFDWDDIIEVIEYTAKPFFELGLKTKGE